MSVNIRHSKSMLYLLAALISVTFALLGCSQEGPTEKAGKQIDEAIEKIQHGDEGTMEKTGRKIDETIEAAKDELNK